MGKAHITGWHIACIPAYGKGCSEVYTLKNIYCRTVSQTHTMETPSRTVFLSSGTLACVSIYDNQSLIYIRGSPVHPP